MQAHTDTDIREEINQITRKLMDGIPGVEGRAAIQRDWLEESISRNVTQNVTKLIPTLGWATSCFHPGWGGRGWGCGPAAS